MPALIEAVRSGSRIVVRSAIVHRQIILMMWGGSTIGENTMVRSLILGAALVIGIATIANAGFAPNAIGNDDKSVIRIAEECGPGWWRGPEGRCHPMAKGRVCPKGYHLGPEGERCLPN
jgi:hypothetical protein